MTPERYKKLIRQRKLKRFLQTFGLTQWRAEILSKKILSLFFLT